MILLQSSRRHKLAIGIENSSINGPVVENERHMLIGLLDGLHHTSCAGHGRIRLDDIIHLVEALSDLHVHVAACCGRGVVNAEFVRAFRSRAGENGR